MHNLLKKYVKFAYNKLNESNEEEINVKEKQITDINKKLKSLEERFINEQMSQEIFEKFHFKLKAEKKEIEAKNKEPLNKVSNLDFCIKKR